MYILWFDPLYIDRTHSIGFAFGELVLCVIQHNSKRFGFGTVFSMTGSKILAYDFRSCIEMYILKRWGQWVVHPGWFILQNVVPRYDGCSSEP